MATVFNINLFRVRQARRQLPLILYRRSPDTLAQLDNRIHRALGLMLADNSLEKSDKLAELRRTRNLYRQVVQSLKNCQQS